MVRSRPPENAPPIRSAQNEKIQRLRRLVGFPRECRRENLLVADGIHLVQEAIARELICDTLLFDADADHPEILQLLDRARLADWPLLPVERRLLRSISPVESPQGIIGFFQRPEWDGRSVLDRPVEENASPHVVVCCGLQDPSNVGAITRSALAAGMHALFTTPGTVDPYHHRALRASMGAAFRLPILREEPTGPLLAELRGRGLRILGLTPRGSTEITEVDSSLPHALLLGSEGGGLESGFEPALDLQVRIPTHPEVESLGVAAAAAVAFYWLCRFGTRPSG